MLLRVLRLKGQPRSLPHFAYANPLKIRTQRFSSVVKDEELIYPDAPSTHHSDLASFLSYADRNGLSPQSTVYVGTHYEYTVAAALIQYGFLLKRIGGASDYGTDLLGTWTPPSTNQTMKVLLQCKAGVQRTGPQYVRELEGAFVGAPVGWRGPGVLGLLVSERPATKGVRDSLGRSQWAMGYICCTKDGALRQMIWNRKAELEGLEGFSMGVKHAPGTQDGQLVMLRHGKILPYAGAGKVATPVVADGDG